MRTAHDKDGGTLSKGGAHFDVRIITDGQQPHDAAAARVVDNGDGTYTATYSPADTPGFTVSVQHRGQHLPGSPFQVEAQAETLCSFLTTAATTTYAFDINTRGYIVRGLARPAVVTRLLARFEPGANNTGAMRQPMIGASTGSAWTAAADVEGGHWWASMFQPYHQLQQGDLIVMNVEGAHFYYTQADNDRKEVCSEIGLTVESCTASGWAASMTVAQYIQNTFWPDFKLGYQLV